MNTGGLCKDISGLVWGFDLGNIGDSSGKANGK